MGFLLGVSVGIGFVITETIIYGLRYSDQSFPVIIAFLFIRLLGAGSMHALSTGISGYGYSEYITNKRSVTYLASFFICAIGVHALFNLITFSAQVYNQVFLIILSVMFSMILILTITKKIYLYERNKIFSNLTH
jgi:RsiW-degrading membrane proteinase PrsW (M82 family)